MQQTLEKEFCIGFNTLPPTRFVSQVQTVPPASCDIAPLCGSPGHSSCGLLSFSCPPRSSGFPRLRISLCCVLCQGTPGRAEADGEVANEKFTQLLLTDESGGVRRAVCVVW